MISTIDSFRDEYAFLSNFYDCAIRYDDQTYFSVEHAYQAAKTLDPEQRKKIQWTKSPAEVKRLGRSVTLRPDWDEIKFDLMLKFLIQKFKYPDLRAQLLATGKSALVETNWWGDTYWGVCNGIGENVLGNLLSYVRELAKSGDI